MALSPTQSQMMRWLCEGSILGENLCLSLNAMPMFGGVVAGPQIAAQVIPKAVSEVAPMVQASLKPLQTFGQGLWSSLQLARQYAPAAAEAAPEAASNSAFVARFIKGAIAATAAGSMAVTNSLPGLPIPSKDSQDKIRLPGGTVEEPVIEPNQGQAAIVEPGVKEAVRLPGGVDGQDGYQLPGTTGHEQIWATGDVVGSIADPVKLAERRLIHLQKLLEEGDTEKALKVAGDVAVNLGFSMGKLSGPIDEGRIRLMHREIEAILRTVTVLFEERGVRKDVYDRLAGGDLNEASYPRDYWEMYGILYAAYGLWGVLHKVVKDAGEIPGLPNMTDLVLLKTDISILIRELLVRSGRYEEALGEGAEVISELENLLEGIKAFRGGDRGLKRENRILVNTALSVYAQLEADLHNILGNAGKAASLYKVAADAYAARMKDGRNLEERASLATQYLKVCRVLIDAYRVVASEEKVALLRYRTARKVTSEMERMLGEKDPPTYEIERYANYCILAGDAATKAGYGKEAVEMFAQSAKFYKFLTQRSIIKEKGAERLYLVMYHLALNRQADVLERQSGVGGRKLVAGVRNEIRDIETYLKDGLAWLMVGEVLLEGNRMSEAMWCFEQVIRVFDGQESRVLGNALFLRGDARLKNGDKVGAKKDYDEAHGIFVEARDDSGIREAIRHLSKLTNGNK